MGTSCQPTAVRITAGPAHQVLVPTYTSYHARACPPRQYISKLCEAGLCFRIRTSIDVRQEGFWVATEQYKLERHTIYNIGQELVALMSLAIFFVIP